MTERERALLKKLAEDLSVVKYAVGRSLETLINLLKEGQEPAMPGKGKDESPGQHDGECIQGMPKEIPPGA